MADLRPRLSPTNLLAGKRFSAGVQYDALHYDLTSLKTIGPVNYPHEAPNIFSRITTRQSRENVPFTSTEDGGVEFDENLMEVDRPYPYCLAGVWFVAVRHSADDGDVEIYHFSREDRK